MMAVYLFIDTNQRSISMRKGMLLYFALRLCDNKSLPDKGRLHKYGIVVLQYEPKRN